MVLKYTPICVRIPGATGDDVALTAGEARRLISRLQRELRLYDSYAEAHGVKRARILMGKRTLKLGL